MQLLDQYKKIIHSLCDSHHVERLYVFGSVLTDQFNANSDIDFVVDFQPMDKRQYADNYFDLKFSLEEILQRHVDLLEEKAIKNPFFEQSIANQKQLIYANG